MSRKQNRQHVTVSLDDTQFKILYNAIQNLIKVIAATQIKLDKGTEYNAKFLKVFNLTDQEIADLLGVDRSTVTKALSKSKQKSSGV
ncbi:MAG: hypothetical protein ACP5IT_06335 [Thermoproteota archaeon]|jgi:CRP-like cAMP-binding protein